MRTVRKVKLRRGRKWPVSVTTASKRLGVTEAHLAKVLKGERSSVSLKSKYELLVQELQGEGRAA